MAASAVFSDLLGSGRVPTACTGGTTSFLYQSIAGRERNAVSAYRTSVIARDAVNSASARTDLDRAALGAAQMRTLGERNRRRPRARYGAFTARPWFARRRRRDQPLDHRSVSRRRLSASTSREPPAARRIGEGKQRGGVTLASAPTPVPAHFVRQFQQRM